MDFLVSLGVLLYMLWGLAFTYSILVVVLVVFVLIAWGTFGGEFKKGKADESAEV